MRDDLFAEASQGRRFGRPVPERKKLNSHLYLSCQTLDHAVPKPLHVLISLGLVGRNAPVREPLSRKAEDLKKPLSVFLSSILPDPLCIEGFREEDFPTDGRFSEDIHRGRFL
jgi:hypothetical protein